VTETIITAVSTAGGLVIFYFSLRSKLNRVSDKVNGLSNGSVQANPGKMAEHKAEIQHEKQVNEKQDRILDNLVEKVDRNTGEIIKINGKIELIEKQNNMMIRAFNGMSEANTNMVVAWEKGIQSIEKMEERILKKIEGKS